MKKPYYTDVKRGSRLEVTVFNGGLVGKIFNDKTNVCTQSHVFRDEPNKQVTIDDIKQYFNFDTK